MFGQFSTCDLVEFQRLLWSGGGRNQNNQVVGVSTNNVIVGQQQPQYITTSQQPTIITGVHQPAGGLITTNNNNPGVIQNTMPVQRQQNFLNQGSVSFTTQPTTRYIPNQPQSRGMNQSQSSLVQVQQQQQNQPHFSQIVPLDLGKQAQELRAREMVPEFEEQYFIQSTSPTKMSSSGRQGQSQSSQLHRPQPHVPTSQAISDHLSRSYPQQDLIQMHRQRIIQEDLQQSQSRHSKKAKYNAPETYETMVEFEVDDHQDDDDYEEEADEEEEEEEEEDYDEEYEPVSDTGPWRCGGCRKEYKRKNFFLEHQKQCKKKEKPSHQVLQNQQGPAYKCAICGECYLTDKTFQKHMNTHGQQSGGRKNSKKQSKELQAAISSITGNGGQQQPYYQPPVMFLFKCEYCTDQFSTQQDLKAHEQQHLQETTLRCTTCEQPFLREDEFNKHLKAHLIETIWKCNVCAQQFTEYKPYRDHLQTHLPVVYKDPPPKPPEPEKTEDDDIVEMEVIEDDDPSKMTSPEKKSPSKSRLADLAGGEWVPSRPSTSKALAARRYATGSNMKITAKGSSSKDIIVRKMPNAKNPKEFVLVTSSKPGSSSSGNKNQTFDDDDDDVLILNAPTKPHRPIPIHVTPINAKKFTNVRGSMPNLKSHTTSPNILSKGRASLPAGSKPSHKKKAPQPKKHTGRGRPRRDLDFAPPNDFHIIDSDIHETYRFQCIVCKSYLPDKASRQQHILKKHCSQKSIEIKLLKLEDDPELDLEIIDDDEGAKEQPEQTPMEQTQTPVETVEKE